MGYVAVYNNYGIWVCPGKGDIPNRSISDNHDDSDQGTQLGHRELEAIKPQNNKMKPTNPNAHTYVEDRIWIGTRVPVSLWGID